MLTRRLLLSTALATLVISNRLPFAQAADDAGPVSPVQDTLPGGFERSPGAPEKSFPLMRTPEEWRKKLSVDQYLILRRGFDEMEAASPLFREKRTGTYKCVGCDQELFLGSSKYDGGTGWPSFFMAVENSVESNDDEPNEEGGRELHCSRCGSHLGMVFADGPPPTGLRFRVNGTALNFFPLNPSRKN